MNKYLLIPILFLTLALFNSCEDEQEDYSNQLFVGGKINIYYTFTDSAGTEVYEKTEEKYGMPIRFQMFENGVYLRDVIADSWGYILNVGVNEGKQYQLKFVIEDEVLFESEAYVPKKSESEYKGADDEYIKSINRFGLRSGYHFLLKDFEMRIESDASRLFVRPNPFNTKTFLDIMLTSSNTFSYDMFNLHGDKYEIEPYLNQELNRTLPNGVNLAKLQDSIPEAYYLFRVISGDETFYQMAVRDFSSPTFSK